MNDIDMYYEIHGEGEPLLLIEGLGYSTWMWFKQVPTFSREYRVIAFDNRGIGNTDKPDREYTIGMMADDAAALLKALGVDSANVLGVSMGGFIAQEMALRYPDMVKSLILVSTSFGTNGVSNAGSNHLWGTLVGLFDLIPAILELSGKGSNPVPMFNSLGLTAEKRIRYGLSLAFTPEYLGTHTEEIDRIVGWRLENPQPFYAWKRQLIAGMEFDSSDRVHRIKAPTLVITGSQDRVIPPESSKALAERIPGSQFIEIEEAGHLPFIERAEEFNRLVLGFLRESARKGKPRGREEGGRGFLRRMILSLLGRSN